MTNAPERELAYQAYINEVMPNGYPRLTNIVLHNNSGLRTEQHIATVIDQAFQAGWLASAEAAEQLLLDVGSSLAAAVSLLENGGKKAAPSDKMFNQMIKDYNDSLVRLRSFFETHDNHKEDTP